MLLLITNNKWLILVKIKAQSGNPQWPCLVHSNLFVKDRNNFSMYSVYIQIDTSRFFLDFNPTYALLWPFHEYSKPSLENDRWKMRKLFLQIQWPNAHPRFDYWVYYCHLHCSSDWAQWHGHYFCLMWHVNLDGDL